MKLYGIFDTNQNYKLIRYSTQAQAEIEYQETDPTTKQTYMVHEVCLSEIEYSNDNIGKHYDPSNGTFSS